MHSTLFITGRLFVLALAAWMAVLPVLGAMATTHGALHSVRSLATVDGAVTSARGDESQGHHHADTDHHADHHSLIAGMGAHGDTWSSFIHDLAHVWECCAQSVATFPLTLSHSMALRPEAPALPPVVAVAMKSLETLLRPPIR